MSFREPYEAVLNGARLSVEEAEQAFGAIMEGGVEPLQIAAFLGALRARGETVDELTGAARSLRAKSHMVSAPEGAIDTAGTGGDFSHTYNISTAAAIVAAASGVPVAKHGNRAMSSKSGSADVLASLGIDIALPASVVEASIRDIGIGFLMATKYHAAMAHVAPVRKALAARTVFNLLGPLSNPAHAKRQLIGVFAPEWLEPIAEVAGRLGADHVWVVHGSGGLDELSTLGPTEVAEWKDGRMRRFQIDAVDYGLKRAELVMLQGGDAAQNAAALQRLLNGEESAYRDIVVLNAAAALIVGAKADTLDDALAQAAAAIDTGAAADLLSRWAHYGKEAA